MTPDFSFDVFLSYNSDDKPRVLRLAERLRDAGVRVWFDAWIIRPGDDIYLAIEHGLEAARTLVLCLSPAALGSNWVGLERSTVLFRDPSNAGRRFIPLLLANCNLPDTLRRYRYVDFREETDATFLELLTACRPESKEAAPGSPGGARHGAANEPGKQEPLAVLEWRLTGHRGPVECIAVSPDGKWAASGSADARIKIWDLATGECRTTLNGHTQQVSTIAISLDGQKILSGSWDATIRVWNSSGGQHLSTFSFHGLGRVNSLLVYPDGVTALSVGDDTSAHSWVIESGKRIGTIWTGDRPATAAIINDGGHIVVAVGSELRIVDLKNRYQQLQFRGHTQDIRSIQILPSRNCAVTGSSDQTIKIWDLTTGACIGTLEGHEGSIHSVAISADGTLIASTGSTDRTVRLWDANSGNCLQVIEPQPGLATTHSVVFSPDGRQLLVGTGRPESAVYVYRIGEFKAAQAAEQASRYMNAKVVLVGASGVGKSGLAHRLIEDRFVQTHSTHGMQVWRLDLPLDPEDGLEREALLWDLAGQEDYRLIHQLFLDETALALLLFDPQHHDPFAEVGAWLKVLRNTIPADKGREVAQILVAARIDRGNVKVSQKKIDRFLEVNSLAAYLSTSAVRGDNCSDAQAGGIASPLKELIAKHIPWERLPWTSTPRLLAELKNAIVAMTEQKNVRLLRFAELVQRLEQTLPQERFDEPDVRTAVKLLANHGLVLPLKFGDLVLLRPELLNGYASAVIRAARNHTDEIGCVKEQAVFDRTMDLEGVERLEPADEELLMRAMVQTFLDKSLCIAEDTPEGRHLVFPSQYRQERPIPSHPEIFVSYTFSGEWQTVYTTLVVRLWYSREFQHRELWRNAAEFETSKGRRVGLLMERTEEGKGTVSVFFETGVPDELKLVFIEYVRRHLEKYARDVGRDRRYVCPKCAWPVKDLDAVGERLEAKKDFIYCAKCDEKVPLIDHVEQQHTSDPVAHRVLRMDQTASQELDTQALEQILTGHMMAICGEANQIFRKLAKFDYGIDGEIEFKDNDGAASGRKVHVQLQIGGSYLPNRNADGKAGLDLRKARHLAYRGSQPVDVYLVARDGEGTIRWMNVTSYLEERQDKESRQIVFEGEKLDASAVWRVRDQCLR